MKVYLFSEPDTATDAPFLSVTVTADVLYPSAGVTVIVIVLPFSAVEELTLTFPSAVSAGLFTVYFVTATLPPPEEPPLDEPPDGFT